MNGDKAIEHIERYKNDPRIRPILVDLYAGAALGFSTDEQREQFKRLWNVDLEQGG
jgi:hypothetical protein